MACCGHDALDWFAAIGPAAAAFFAAWIAWDTYKRGERLQRQLARPLISIRHNLAPGTNVIRWIIELRNDGASAANIERFRVLVKGEALAAETLQSPDNYWRMVLVGLGALQIRGVTNTRIVRTPLALGGGSQLTLFDATLGGESPALEKVISNLELRLNYTSAFGDEFECASRYLSS